MGQGNFSSCAAGRLDGLCCMTGECKKPTTPAAGKNNTMLWIGILLIILVIAGVIFLLKSRFKKKPKKAIAEELKKIEERYNPESRIEK